jgi:hypothetical protein
VSARRLVFVVVATFVAAAAPPAAAQVSAAARGTTVGGSVAFASLWDDETHLGRGLALAGEVSVPAGRHARVGVEGGWFGHDRDAGYLRAAGSVASLMARASLLVGPRRWRARPLVGVSAGFARSTGTLTTASPGSGAIGALPTEPAVRRRWTLTRPAWDVHVGVRVAASERLFVRPFLSAGFIGGSGGKGVLEPPLLRLQGGVAVELALTR